MTPKMRIVMTSSVVATGRRMNVSAKFMADSLDCPGRRDRRPRLSAGRPSTPGRTLAASA